MQLDEEILSSEAAAAHHAQLRAMLDAQVPPTRAGGPSPLRARGLYHRHAVGFARPPYGA